MRGHGKQGGLNVISAPARLLHGNQDFPVRTFLGCLPVVCVRDLGTSTALPDGLAIRHQGLEVICQFEPIVRAARVQKCRDHFLLPRFGLRHIAGRAARRFFGAGPQHFRLCLCSRLPCH